MKKSLLKILGTILTIIAFIVVLHNIRRYYNIDSRIWFFVVYGVSFVELCIILDIFYFEIESMIKNFKIHSFSYFISEISRKIKSITKKIKPVTEKVTNSFIYNIISSITTMGASVGMTYDLFFHDDFIARTTIYIIFLVMIALKGLSLIISATVMEKEKRTKEFVYAGMWVFVFFIFSMKFVSI